MPGWAAAVLDRIKGLLALVLAWCAGWVKGRDDERRHDLSLENKELQNENEKLRQHVGRDDRDIADRLRRRAAHKRTGLPD